MDKQINIYVCPKCKKICDQYEARGYNFKCPDCKPMYSIAFNKETKIVSADRGY